MQNNLSEMPASNNAVYESRRRSWLNLASAKKMFWEFAEEFS